MIEQIDFVAMTVKMEAENQDFLGKLAVAFVIVNRAESQGRSFSDIIFQDYQFSCWNTTDPTQLRLDDLDTNRQVWLDAYKASWAAVHHLVPDPTRGSTSYLNPGTCTPEQKHKAGYVKAHVRYTHGQHDFFIAV